MSCAGGPDLITDNMVLSVDFCNRNSYAVGSSNYYNGVTKQYVGGVGGGTYSTKYNGSLTYGLGNYFDGPALSTFGIANNFTINLFFEWISGTGPNVSMLIASEVYNTNGFRCGLDPVNNRLYFWSVESGGNFLLISPNGTCQTGPNPFYVTISFNSSTGTAKIYKNGILLASQTGATLIAPTQSYFRVNETLNGTSASIIIGHLSMYNRELSELQVLQNYRNLKSRFRLT